MEKLKMKTKEPIAVKHVTAFYSVMIYDIDENECKALTRCTNDPRMVWCTIFYTSYGEAYIRKHGQRHYLDEFIRV